MYLRQRWRERDYYQCLDQVANARDSKVDLTPASEARAMAVRAAWLPLLSGQVIPLIGERRYDDYAESCEYD